METTTELNFELLEQSFEKPACVYDTHDIDLEAHGGETKWYMQFQCGGCGNKNSVHAYCDGFRNWVSVKTNHLSCDSCFKTTSASDALILCKRIDGNW